MQEFNITWDMILEDEEVDFQFKHVIVNFFKKDKIDLNKYLENQRANEICLNHGSLSFWEKNLDYLSSEDNSVNCTPTFREHFAEDSLKRSPHVPIWFYIAYPDVEVWFHKRRSQFNRIVMEREDEFVRDNKLTLNFYRFIIDEFIEINGFLECS